MSTEKKPTNFLLTLFVCLFVCLSIVRISTRRLSIRPSLIIRYIDDRIDVKNICLFNICIYIYIHRMNVERNANFRTNFFWIGQTKIRIHFKRRSLSDYHSLTKRHIRWKWKGQNRQRKTTTYPPKIIACFQSKSCRSRAPLHQRFFRQTTFNVRLSLRRWFQFCRRQRDSM